MSDDMQVTALADKVQLVLIQFGKFGNSKKIDSERVNTNADKKRVKASKTLLDSPELKAITTADGAMRAWINFHVLPYHIAGVYILPNGIVTKVHKRLQEYRQERELLVDAFIEAYPQRCKDASEELGDLHNVMDYLSTEEARKEFVFSWEFLNFGVAGSLKVVDSEIYNEAVSKAESNLKSAAEEITKVRRATLLALVSHLQDILTPGPDGKRKKLYDTTVTKLTDFLSMFKLTDVTGDSELETLANTASNLMQGLSVDALKSDDALRDSIKLGMEKISLELSGMVETKVTRKIRDTVSTPVEPSEEVSPEA
jgi:hypothetical protein